MDNNKFGVKHIHASNLLFLIVCTALLLTGCASGTGGARQSDTLATSAAAISSPVLLLPVDIKVHEISAGGVSEEVPDWSQQACTNFERSLSAQAASRFKLVNLDDRSLDTGEREIVEEHLRLYDVVAQSAYLLTSENTGSAWQHKRDHFDYTIGNGLAFLKERTGAERALVVTGYDYVSSGERKAASVFAAMLGIAIPLGHTTVLAGLIDLSTGDILWLNQAYSYADRDLRSFEDCSEIVEDLLENLPISSPRQQI